MSISIMIVLLATIFCIALAVYKRGYKKERNKINASKTVDGAIMRMHADEKTGEYFVEVRLKNLSPGKILRVPVARITNHSKSKTICNGLRIRADVHMLSSGEYNVTSIEII